MTLLKYKEQNREGRINLICFWLIFSFIFFWSMNQASISYLSISKVTARFNFYFFFKVLQFYFFQGIRWKWWCSVLLQCPRVILHHAVEQEAKGRASSKYFAPGTVKWATKPRGSAELPECFRDLSCCMALHGAVWTALTQYRHHTHLKIPEKCFLPISICWKKKPKKPSEPVKMVLA